MPVSVVEICICLFAGGHITCCVCRQVSMLSNMIDNMFVPETPNTPASESDAMIAHNCTGCEENIAASHFCTDCSEWLCEPCAQAHRRVKVTKEHSVVPVDKMSSNSAAAVTSRNLSAAATSASKHLSLMCPTHPREPLILYCETCVKLTCRDCQLGEHRDHKYQFVQVNTVTLG